MRKKIMVVDGDPDILITIRNIFEREGYEVFTVDSGKKCYELFKNNEIPDLILLDIMMPGMSGWMLFDRLKENPSWKNIPVVFLTVRTDSFAKKAGNSLCEDYIEKPFDIEDLKKRIDKVMKENNSESL